MLLVFFKIIDLAQGIGQKQYYLQNDLNVNITLFNTLQMGVILLVLPGNVLAI